MIIVDTHCHAGLDKYEPIESLLFHIWTLDKFLDDQQLDLVKYVVLWHHQSLNLFLKETIDDLG